MHFKKIHWHQADTIKVISLIKQLKAYTPNINSFSIGKVLVPGMEFVKSLVGQCCHYFFSRIYNSVSVLQRERCSQKIPVDGLGKDLNTASVLQNRQIHSGEHCHSGRTRVISKGIRNFEMNQTWNNIVMFSSIIKT